MNVRRRSSQTKPLRATTVFKKIVIATGALLGAVIGILTILGTHGKVFPTISEVECVTVAGEQCQPNVAATVQTTLAKTPILFSNIPTTVNEPLLNTGFLLTTYQRQWPNTVKLTVAQAPLVYQIKTPSGIYGVMHDRRIVTLNEPQQVLNTVHMLDSARPNDFVPPWLHTAITNTVAVIHPTNMELISPVELRINVDATPMEFILNPQEIEENLSRMHAIVTSTETAALASAPGELDMRLRLPVLRKKP